MLWHDLVCLVITRLWPGILVSGYVVRKRTYLLNCIHLDSLLNCGVNEIDIIK